MRKNNKVCQFFKQGNCKYGPNCKYEHPKQIPQDQSPSNHHKKRNQPQKQFYNRQMLEQQPVQNSKQQQLNKNRKIKMDYLQQMMQPLKRSCLKCNKKKFLVISSCLCEKICKDCVIILEKCPSCNKPNDRNVFIG